MRSLFRTIGLCALILVSALWHSNANGDDEAVSVFEQVGGRWIKHYLANDLDGLMELYTSDATVMLHGKPAMQGKEAIRAFFAASMGTADVTFDIDVEQAEIHDNVAYLISKYWMSIKPHGGNEMFTDVGRSLLIYKKDTEGVWKIHADIDQATPDVSWPPPDKD